MLIALASRAALSQSNTNPLPHDGRYWKAMSDGGRIAYLTGYADGASEGAIESATESDPKRLSNMDAQSKHVFPSNLTFGEIEESLNTFYQVPENRALPISIAIRVVAMKFFPVTQEQIDRFVEKMRVEMTRQSSN